MPRRRQTGSPHRPPRWTNLRPSRAWRRPPRARAGRGHRRRRVHRAVDRALPAAGRPCARRRGARGGARRLRCERTQRWLGVGPLAGRSARRWPAAAARAAARAMVAELQNTVDEVGRATESAAIDCGFRKGGAIALARLVRRPGQPGPGPRSTDAGAVGHSAPAGSTPPRPPNGWPPAGSQGATFTPHCARVHPRRLVDGLAADGPVAGRPGARGCAGAARSSPDASCSRTAGRSRPDTSSGPPRRGPPRCPASAAPSPRSTRSWWPRSRSARGAVGEDRARRA